MNRSLTRVLILPYGKKQDADGRTLGEDWLLADFGETPDGDHVYLTTDRVRASEFGSYPILKSCNLARFLQSKIDLYIKEFVG